MKLLCIFTPMNTRSFLLGLVFLPALAYPQQKERPLPPSINQPSVNLFAPYVSGDGKTLVYLSDYSDDGHHIMYWSTREGREWNEGTEVNKLINRPTHNLRGGYALNYTGDELYFTSRKSGLGGYDIWISQRVGNDWGAPKNLGAPLNSRLNEGAPSLTADGNTMYFMQCDKMFEYKVAQGCKIMVSKKVRGKWQAPAALPSNINTGNAQMPRILGDDLTLLFASDIPGGKGGLDLYVSRLDNEQWTEPVPVADLNGPDHDAFISAAAKGRYVYRSRKGSRNMELVETLLPEEAQSYRVHRINGTYTGPARADLRVFDTETRSRHTNLELEPGDEFSLVLKEGPWYDISIVSQVDGYAYYARLLNLGKVGRIDRETIEVGLKDLNHLDTLSSVVEFDMDQCNWTSLYDFEMRRLADLLRSNADLKLEFIVLNPSYREDSINRPMLTETRYDTLYSPMIDSLAIYPDPLANNTRKIYPAGDSLLIIHAKDSILIARQDIQVDTIYHNDRTSMETAKLKTFLIDRQVDTARFIITTRLVPAIDEKRPRFLSENDGTIPEEQVRDRIIAVLKD